MLKNRINVVVAGATGYVGLGLVNLLSKHPKVSIQNLCSKNNIGKKIQYFDKNIKKKLPKLEKLTNVNWKNIDLLFLSLPNGEAQKVIKNLFYKYKNIKFIDLSSDFRIENHILYKKNYNLSHKAKDLISKSLYSIAEIKKKQIKDHRIIANPGCYPTSIQLPLIPLFKKKLIKLNNITIDSKSGYSGAGKNYKKKFKYKNFFNSTYAYSVNYHRHAAELEQEFAKISKKISFTFNPHIIPTFRGILSSIYVYKKKNVSFSKIVNTLKKEYSKNYFIKICKPNNPLGTGNVINTNFCEISISQLKSKNKLVILSVIDNLIKGASGQAIQNMNLLFKFKESLGLK